MENTSLIPSGAVFQRGNRPLTTSLCVAETFGKRHDHVLRDIEALRMDLAPQIWGAKSDDHDPINEFQVRNYEDAANNNPSDQHPTFDLPKIGEIEAEFNLLNFEEVTYTDQRNRQQKMYLLTKDGFTLLVMGYTGAEALRFKVAYINEFNRMAAALSAPMLGARKRTQLLDPAISLAVDKILELMSIMADRQDFTEGLHFQFINKRTQIAFDFSLMYDDLRKYRLDYGLTLENLYQKDFIKHLRQKAYFVAYRAARFILCAAGRPSEKIIKKAYILDLNGLRNIVGESCFK